MRALSRPHHSFLQNLPYRGTRGEATEIELTRVGVVHQGALPRRVDRGRGHGVAASRPGHVNARFVM
eukprot:1896800-Prymnesium_polylepis.1